MLFDGDTNNVLTIACAWDGLPGFHVKTRFPVVESGIIYTKKKKKKKNARAEASCDRRPLTDGRTGGTVFFWTDDLKL